MKVVFVVTEDTGEVGRKAVELLLKRLLHEVEFRVPQEEAHLAAGPPMWAAKRGIDGVRRLRLVRQITTRLLRDQHVIFHYDGDNPWSKRAKTRTDQFNEAWVDRCVATATADGRTTTTAQQQRLVPMVPYWSLEAWLYRAVAKARELCERGYKYDDRRRSLELLSAWEASPSLLDDHEKPKDCVCLKNGHNDVLAAEVDLHQLDAAQTSFTEFVDALVGAGLSVRTRT